VKKNTLGPVAKRTPFIWTLQPRDFLTQHGDILTVSKENISYQNWKQPYQWMERQYRQRVGRLSSSHALIWVWLQQSRDEAEFYRTVTTLEPSYHYGLKGKVAIVLNLPAGIVLKSSYNRWNILLDYCLTFKRKPSADSDWHGVFDVRELSQWDHLQGVIPFLQRDWIKATIELDKSKLKKYGADFRKH
jgi:hypothetical protein